MTRQEAIYRIKNTAWLGSDEDREATEEAVKLAIEALEREPTNEIVACYDCQWSNDCSQLIYNLEHTASTSLRWCSDGVRRA